MEHCKHILFYYCTYRSSQHLSDQSTTNRKILPSRPSRRIIHHRDPSRDTNRFTSTFMHTHTPFCLVNKEKEKPMILMACHRSIRIKEISGIIYCPQSIEEEIFTRLRIRNTLGNFLPTLSATFTLQMKSVESVEYRFMLLPSQLFSINSFRTTTENLGSHWEFCEVEKILQSGTYSIFTRALLSENARKISSMAVSLHQEV